MLTKQGGTVVRALWHEFPRDNTTWTIGEQNGGQKTTKDIFILPTWKGGGGVVGGLSL